MLAKRLEVAERLSSHSHGYVEPHFVQRARRNGPTECPLIAPRNEEFFSHGFVDLEHMAGPESLGKAKELVLQAVGKDQEGERAAALSLYCSALEHFVPAIHCFATVEVSPEQGSLARGTADNTKGDSEPQGRRRELLHSEIKSLMNRAEYLKENIKMQETQKD
ncbi:hypothetical protein CRUP_022401, partial [Coryphaenoides rupestris]